MKVVVDPFAFMRTKQADALVVMVIYRTFYINKVVGIDVITENKRYNTVTRVEPFVCTIFNLCSFSKTRHGL